MILFKILCVHGGINLMFHYMPWCISLCQNTTLHFGWENLHLGVGLGPNPIEPEVQNGYMTTLDKLGLDREECARLRLE